jgi:hypothetical protein
MAKFIKWNGPAFAAQIRRHPTAYLEPVLTDIFHTLLFIAYEGIVIGNRFGNPSGTPVQTGWAKGSWYPEIGSITVTAQAVDDATRQAGGDPSGSASMGRATVLADAPMGTWVYYVNGAIYAIMLEYGTSEQAPAGMVRLITRSGQLILNHAVRMIAR